MSPRRGQDPGIDGFLVIDKAAGMTSHDVVAHLRKLLVTRRVGHAGTLDPAATGILLVGIGRATRLLGYSGAEEKEYVAVVRFGSRTTTLDAEGSVVERVAAGHLTREMVDAALEPFRGEIEQIPPMVSALKVDGERLHVKARRGEEVEREPRKVTISTLELQAFEAGEEPTATLRVECSPGTYIRTLADDLGVSLGVRAHLASLRRSRVGPWSEADAIALDDVDPNAMRPIEDTVAGLPQVQIDEAAALALRQGRVIAPAGIEGPWAAIAPEGIIAVCRDRGTAGKTIVGIPPPPQNR